MNGTCVKQYICVGCWGKGVISVFWKCLVCTGPVVCYRRARAESSRIRVWVAQVRPAHAWTPRLARNPAYASCAFMDELDVVVRETLATLCAICDWKRSFGFYRVFLSMFGFFRFILLSIKMFEHWFLIFQLTVCTCIWSGTCCTRMMYTDRTGQDTDLSHPRLVRLFVTSAVNRTRINNMGNLFWVLWSTVLYIGIYIRSAPQMLIIRGGTDSAPFRVPRSLTNNHWIMTSTRQRDTALQFGHQMSDPWGWSCIWNLT